MASYPPPPSAPQPPPTPDQHRAAAASYRALSASRREARRAREAVARAQQSAARAQQIFYRNQLRMQARTLRPGSIVDPILVIAAGIVLLLICLGQISGNALLSWYAQWWPVVLIFAGVIRLVEWFLLDRAAAEGRPIPNRHVGNGVILLLILAAVLGVTAPAVGGSSHPQWLENTHIDGLNLQQFLGDKHTSDEDRDLILPADAHLTLNNPNGDVTLTGHSNDGKIHLTTSKTVYGWSSADAESAARRVEPRIDSSASNLSIIVPEQDGSRVDLTLSLPEGTATYLTAGHGDLSISDMKAPVTLTSQHGDLELARIAGQVNIHVSSSGSTVNAHNITGDLILRGHAQDLNLADINGEVSLVGEFFGDGHYEHIAGPVTFETSRTHFHTGRLDGQLDISSGSDFTADHLSGITNLTTHSRNIEFTAISGDIAIENRDGTVDLTTADPAGNITVANRGGAITLNLPAHPSIELSASVQDGNIENNLELTPEKSGSNAQLSARLGDAHNHIDLKTTHADLEIHAGSAPLKSKDTDDDDK